MSSKSLPSRDLDAWPGLLALDTALLGQSRGSQESAGWQESQTDVATGHGQPTHSTIVGGRGL